MPIETVIPKGSKEQRYDAIIPFIANGSIRFKGERRGDDLYMSPENGFKEFQQEYSAFPRGGRDDILDALWIAVHSLTSSVDAVALTEEDFRNGEQVDDQYDLEPIEETAKDRIMMRSGRSSLFHRGIGVF